MAERDSWATTGGIDQEDARMAVGALMTPGSTAISAKTGFRPGPGVLTPGTVSATGTPDGYVHVTAFQAFLQTSRATPGGPYIMTLDATEDVNILSTPADPSNPRYDLIIAHQADVYYGDGTSDMTITQVVGTPSGTPSDPSLAAYPNCIQLARVRVEALATSITAAKITDLRPDDLYTVGIGGIHPVSSEAVRDAIVGMYPGYAVYRTDRDWLEIYDGSAWRVQGTPLVSSLADCSAITDPQTGMIASDSTTDAQYRYDGSTWAMIGSWVDYTSTFVLTASPTPPTKGNSTYEARYCRIGDTVDVSILITIGSTFSAGSGIYEFSLPFAPRAGYMLIHAYILDFGTAERMPYGGRQSATPQRVILSNTTASFVSASHPQTWAANDVIAINIRYEAS